MNLENTILADRNQKAGKKLIIGKLFYFYDRKEYFVIDNHCTDKITFF